MSHNLIEPSSSFTLEWLLKFTFDTCVSVLIYANLQSSKHKIKNRMTVIDREINRDNATSQLKAKL